MIYMNSSCEASYDWSKVVANDTGLWIANYGPNDGGDYGVPGLKYWPFWAIHQFTSRYSGNSLDADIFQGDEVAWDKYAGKKDGSAPAPAPAPEPVRKSVEELATEVIRGEWGNEQERYDRLTAAGYDYDAVQNRVNQILGQDPVAQYYVIQPGDTLSGISAKFGTSVQKLVEWNNIQNPDLIFSGAKIRVS